MFDPVVRQLREVAPSFFTDLKSAIARGKRLMRKSRFWEWTREEISPPGVKYNIHFWGARDRREAALATLRRKMVTPELDDGVITISEIPFRQSLRVPQYLDVDVPLNASLDDVLATYGEKLRRVVLQQLPYADLTEARTKEDFFLADETMLRPYAIDRHGPTAAQIPFDQVVRMSQPPYGRLHILRIDGEPVACHLGVHDVRRGQRYWTAVRFGYIRAVFADPKRLHQVNSTNVFLATKFAKEFGADFYSLGMTSARPDDGLLHWKRRRGGILNARNCNEWFYVRAPQNEAPTFFWGGPLFAMHASGNRLSLHVGLPAEVDEASVVDRYRQIHFLGIDEVIIHHELSSPQALIEKTAALLTEGTDVRVTHRVHASCPRAASLRDSPE